MSEKRSKLCGVCRYSYSPSSKRVWLPAACTFAIALHYLRFGVWPMSSDWEVPTPDHPDRNRVTQHFGSWDEARRVAKEVIESGIEIRLPPALDLRAGASVIGESSRR